MKGFAGTSVYVFGVARPTAAGVIDTSFGLSGKTIVAFDHQANDDDSMADVTLQPTGEVILTGTTDLNDANLDTDFALARLTNLSLFVDGFESGVTSAR